VICAWLSEIPYVPLDGWGDRGTRAPHPAWDEGIGAVRCWPPTS